MKVGQFSPPQAVQLVSVLLLSTLPAEKFGDDLTQVLP